MGKFTYYISRKEKCSIHYRIKVKRGKNTKWQTEISITYTINKKTINLQTDCAKTSTQVLFTYTVCKHHVYIQWVQSFTVSGVAFHILGEGGESRRQRGMIKGPGVEEEGLGVLVLKLSDDSVDLICSCSSDRWGGDAHSHRNNRNNYPLPSLGR